MQNNIVVVIVNYNGLADTLHCLGSLEKQSGSDFTTIVVDNGSSENPKRILKEHPDTVLLRRETNGGWAGGNNTGIAYALKRGASAVILLNNDTIVAENFIERMALALQSHPDFGIMGPLVYKMEKPSEVMIEGCLYDRPGHNGFFLDQHVSARFSDVPWAEESEIVNGCCLMARREVFEAIGLIDERFFLLCEESDLCLRAGEGGWKCGVIAEPLVWHKGAMSFKRFAVDPKYYYNPRNLWLLLTKHAGRTPHGRGRLGARLQYLRTIHYMHSQAIETGSKEDTQSLVEGVADAWMGRYGVRGDVRNGVARCLVAATLKMMLIVTIWKNALLGNGRHQSKNDIKKI